MLYELTGNNYNFFLFCLIPARFLTRYGINFSDISFGLSSSGDNKKSLWWNNKSHSAFWNFSDFLLLDTMCVFPLLYFCNISSTFTLSNGSRFWINCAPNLEIRQRFYRTRCFYSRNDQTQICIFYARVWTAAYYTAKRYKDSPQYKRSVRIICIDSVSKLTCFPD